MSSIEDAGMPPSTRKWTTFTIAPTYTRQFVSGARLRWLSWAPLELQMRTVDLSAKEGPRAR